MAVPAASEATTPFGDRLVDRVLARESQLILGIDPDLRALWPQATDGPDADGPPAERAAVAVHRHCRALIDAVAPACVGAKLQLACFERLGPPGWRVLHETAAYARDAGLLVIADGKRGDIDVTATAYGQALFGGVASPFGRLPGLGADLATVNPLMGSDAIAPLVAAARAGGGGVLLLVRTSNPGAADVEDLALADGGTVAERLATLVDHFGGQGIGRHGLADVGAVVGATAPGHLLRLRELMPRAPLLLPGVGAQGGRVEDLAPAFAPGRAGGLISASRSIASAPALDGADPATAARREAERLRAAAWSLA